MFTLLYACVVAHCFTSHLLLLKYTVHMHVYSIYIHICLICCDTELVGLSLVQRAPPGDDDSDYIVFVVHDIVLDYLHQNVPSTKQVGMLLLDQCTHIHVHVHACTVRIM